MNDLFLSPIPDAVERAVRVAQEALSGELGEAAEEAYQAEFERFEADHGDTLDALAALEAPKTALGRLIERVQDWWWEKTSALQGDAADDLDAALAYPVPLLQTHPLQDVPLDYDQIDALMAQAMAEIAEAISQQTAWVSVPFQYVTPDGDGYDPLETVRNIWAAGDMFLILGEGLEENPKLMGQSIGLTHLTGPTAAHLKARLQ